MSERAVVGGAGLQISSIGVVHFGAALATTLFPLAGPLGTVSLRLLGSALALTLVTRPWRLRWTRASLLPAVLFGLVLAVMNGSIYLAFSRLPLATAITLEFLGPLLLTLVTASRRQRVWAVPAAAGVVLLGGSLRAGDLLGVGFALLAGCGWVAYILLTRALGDGAGVAGVALASVVGTVVVLPLGVLTAGAVLLRPHVLVLGLLVGLLSSAIPYSLDLLALRRLPTAVFGVLTSLNPAVAALAGLVVLGEVLDLRALAGLFCVVAASAGVTATTASAARRAREPVPA